MALARYIVNRDPRGKKRAVFTAPADTTRRLRNPWSAKVWTARNLGVRDIAARAVEIFIEDMAEWQGFGEQWRALPADQRAAIVRDWEAMLADSILQRFEP